MWKKITVDITKELIRRSKEDQRLRKLWINSGNSEEFGKQVAKMDADNTSWLKDYVSKNGFPGRSQVGTEGASAAWLLAQHSDDEFQEHVLGLMKSAPSGEHSPTDVAYLEDRVRMNRKEPQIYGTQYKTENGVTTLHSLIDPDNVDKRRESVGLGPLKDSLKEMGL